MDITNLRESLKKPYWVGDLMSMDLNREIIKPGTNPDFPEGALGIRADGDFWAVAALPLEYQHLDFKTIVDELWPEYKDQIVLTPDSGTIEQKIYTLQQECKYERERADFLEKQYMEMADTARRLKAKRPDLIVSPRTKYMATNDYFIKQYEQLLVATAHEAEPYADPAYKGVCKVCKLYNSDRVHSKKYIKKREASGMVIEEAPVLALCADDEPFELLGE